MFGGLSSKNESQLYFELEKRLKIKSGSPKSRVLLKVVPATLASLKWHSKMLSSVGKAKERDLTAIVQYEIEKQFQPKEPKVGFFGGMIASWVISAMVKRAVKLIIRWYLNRK